MYFTTYCIYNMLQYEICSPLCSNKTAQRNSEHCTKLQDEIHNVLRNKVY